MKEKIKDYEQYKRLRKEKAIKKKWPVDKVMKKYDIGIGQLYAWMGRYEIERRAGKQ